MQKNAQSPNGKPSALTAQFYTDNLRHLRGLAALKKGPQPRSTLDDIIGCANAPDVIKELRRRGLSIPCERIKCLDRDGLPVRPGVYYLTDGDLRKVSAFLRRRGA